MGQTATTSGNRKDIPHTTWVDENAKGDNNDGTDLRASVGLAGEEEVSLLSFNIGSPEDLGIPTNAILNKIHIVLRRYVGASGTAVTNMYFLNSDFTENQANWYGPHDETNSTVIWEPAFAGDSESTVNPGLLRGLYIDSKTTTGNETVTFEISNALVVKQSLSFGSEVNVGLWADPSAGATNDAYFQDDSYSHVSNDYQPQYYVTYELPTPSPPRISMNPNPDGVTGIITIDSESDSPDLQKYSLCWSTSDPTPDHDDNVTDFADTGIKQINTEQLTGSPLATEATAYYFRLFAEDSVNTNNNGGASNVVKIIRPDVASAGITPDVTATVNIGQETTLLVTATAIAAHPYGGKFSSVLVNWTSNVSDTAADYVEYKFGNNTSPALTTDGNLTISHKYHTNPSNDYRDAFAVKVKIRDPDGWVSEAFSAGNAMVVSLDPIAHINANKGKVMNSKFVDKNNMLTISAAQSRAVGSDREIQNFLFTCHTGNADTIVTNGAFDNNNEVFDTGSKRVALRHLGSASLQLGDVRLRVFGLASFKNDGTPVNDHSGDFAYYQYTAEVIKPPDDLASQFVEGVTAGAADGTIGNYSYNYFKSIEGAVFISGDVHDTTGERYLLTAYSADWTTKLSGVLLTEDITINEELLLSVDNVEVFKAGDVIKINNELMKVCSTDAANSRLYVSRGLLTTAGAGAHTSGYLFSTTSAHSDNDPISILDPFIINRDLRYRTKTDVTDKERRYRWGGHAQVVGLQTLGTHGLESVAFNDTGNGSGGLFEINNTVTPGTATVYGGGSSVSSATTDKDWFANGFFEDDIISVELDGSSSNGTYEYAKFFKIAAIRRGDASDTGYDELMIYGSDVDDYLRTTITSDDNYGIISRVIQNPTRTVAIFSPSVVTDEVVFETLVYDQTYKHTTSLQNVHHRKDTAFTTVTSTIPNVLDLLTATDYDTDSSTNRLTSADIAILNTNKRRSGGLSATMPLGGDKYPVNVIRNKVGLPTLSVNLRVISTTGLRRIRSLIEGDTYDYVFIDSNQIDSPGTKDVTYRMKLSNGSLNKSPDLGNDYLATLEFVIVGEDVS